MTAADEKPRRLPGTVSTCQLCRRHIVWATTVAGPNGPGGKSQAFDPYESTDGRVAIVPRGGGRLWARALHKDESHDLLTELLGMPHVATCARPDPVPQTPLPGNVADLGAFRRRKGARR